MRRTLLFGLSVLLAACAVPCGTPTVLEQTGAWFGGQVTAPASWSGGGGSSPAPVTAADVALADANGEPVAGLFHQRTDASGGFEIQGVPKDSSYVVTARFTRADGKEATLETLASPKDQTSAGNITLGTTLATMLATEGLKDAVGPVDSAAFQGLASKLDEKLASAATQPADVASALQAARGWVSDDSSLASTVATLHQQAAAPTVTAVQRDAEISRTSNHNPLDALSPVY